VSHYGNSPSKQHSIGSPSVASRSQSVFSKASGSPSLKGTVKRDKSNKESKRRSSRKSDRESLSSIQSPTPTSQWYTTSEQELLSPIITSLGTTPVFELRQEVSMKCSIKILNQGVMIVESVSDVLWTDEWGSLPGSSRHFPVFQHIWPN
jgi:hypothetical protein